MLVTIAASLVVVIVGVWLVAWAFQRRLIYFPMALVSVPEAHELGSAQKVELKTADGLGLGAWFIPSTASRARATVIVFNGNAGNRSFRAPLAAALARRGFSVLLFDYRGYGGNPGTPSETGLVSDARAAYMSVTSRPEVDARRIVYFGESLGSAIAVALASEHPPAAVILRSPFTSLAEIGSLHYPFLPVGWLLRDRFDALAGIKQVVSPLLIIAGDRDGIVPINSSRRLFEAANEPKQFIVISGGDHNDFDLLAGPRMLDAIDGFLRRVMKE